ncbi:hypothetical protein G6N05_03925 [Flavobacterium sp. F372]|uniref:Uncharacterized protein n=1 Tax=Flavobacterium bernardetii TaxID=2813823 RepID=A0ABR7IWC4_9FLAO|nr:hypothetical protein [Flavobacterium bernardetii]MBC5834023.1 hypothetical protein [Flavobacterium bernardetii]NHF69255.1 hypothetical protein [Flavobacterium bernardetii]
MNFISKLTNEFYNLHSDLSKLKNNQKVDIQETKLKIEKTFEVMFSNIHISSNKILEKSSDTLNTINFLLNELENKNSANLESNFETYFNNYRELINIIKLELGVDSLSKENQKLIRYGF